MAEESRAEGTSAPATPTTDKAGEILRKERIAKRIAVETIARDLKLNAKYIKSLEALEYDQIPGEPYLRVYLRSIAKYLMLDPDEILRTYLKERGQDPAQYNATPNKITISMERADKPKIPWAIIGVLVAILLVAGYLGSRLGSGAQDAQSSTSAADSTQAAVGAATDTTKEDSLQAEQFKPVEVVDTAAKVPAKPDTIVFTIQAVKDSSWIQVYADGKATRTTLRPGNSRRFVAIDSINARVGRNSSLKYTLNGKPVENKTLETSSGADIAAFKIDHTGVSAWPPTKWVSVFKQ